MLSNVAESMVYQQQSVQYIYRYKRKSDMVIYMFDGNTILGAKLEKMVAGIREAIQKKFVCVTCVNHSSTLDILGFR
jgi:hypothetical protein